MSLRWNILKRIFISTVGFEARRFEKSLLWPQKAQERTLQRILRSFGQEFSSVQEFRNQYPPSGEVQICLLEERLASQSVVTFEMTSGSSGKPKRIPYTGALIGSFHNMFRLWAWDVLKTVPLKRGSFFFSISPQIKDGGLQEDIDYLQATLKWLLKPFWVVDAAKLRLECRGSFLKRLSYELLRRPDLEIISVWSPTYLLAIFDEIEKHRLEWSTDLSLPLMARQALQYSEQYSEIAWEELWPQLKFVSAWGSAMAERSFIEVKAYFPQAVFQPKGLLATEAPMTIPWSASGGFVPLLSEVFFEFLDSEGSFLLLEDLTVGSIYEVVITTFGGLFRYRLGDLVQVAHFYKRTPCLEFVGRTGDVCDIAGEKLSERAVRSILRELDQDLGFSIVVPDEEARSYILLSEKGEKSALELVEFRLQEVFHYQVARQQGQLRSLRGIPFLNLRQSYFMWLEKNQMRFGDIKEKYLISDLSRARSFLDYLKIAPLPPGPSVQEERV